MSQQKTVVAVLLLFTSLARAQYGSPVGNGNPGYGGTGTAVPSGDYGHKGQDTIASPSEPDGNSEPEPFNFAYQVKDAPSNTDFQHAANSDGKRVTGEYKVLLPDGRNQIVTYIADENGYNAKVNYEGEARPQPGGPSGGYAAAPSYNSPSAASSYNSPSAAPSYNSPSAASSYNSPSAAPSYNSPSAAPSYNSPSAAPSYNSAKSVPSYSPSAAPSYNSPSSAPSYQPIGGYSSSAPSYQPSAQGYPSSAPSYSAPGGVKTSYAAPQPKNGGY